MKYQYYISNWSGNLIRVLNEKNKYYFQVYDSSLGWTIPTPLRSKSYTNKMLSNKRKATDTEIFERLL